MATTRIGQHINAPRGLVYRALLGLARNGSAHVSHLSTDEAFVSQTRIGPGCHPFLAALDHPPKPALLAVREVRRAVDPAIGESVKWNAPSLHTAEHFATFQLRHRPGVQVVLHLGAKPRPGVAVREQVADPTGLLEWRGPDRATVTFADDADFAATRDAFAALVRPWIALVG